MRARQNVRRRQRERAEHGNKCGIVFVARFAKTDAGLT
jgi:hypothetical protein